MAVFSQNHHPQPRPAPIQWRQPNQASQSIRLDPLDNPLAPFCLRFPTTTATAPTLPSVFGYFWSISSSDDGDEPSRLGAGPIDNANNSPEPIDALNASLYTVQPLSQWPQPSHCNKISSHALFNNQPSPG